MADTVESLEIQITHRAGGAASALKSLTSSLKSVSKATKLATSALGNFVNSLKRIAFYRFIRRAVIYQQYLPLMMTERERDDAL